MVDPSESLKGRLSFQRIAQLQLDPVRGNFDVAHLKEINQRILQDFPKYGFTDVTPGEFRPPITGQGNAYIKPRALETTPGTFPVAYSKMDQPAQAALNETLKLARPEALAKLDKGAFVKVCDS